MKTAAIFGVTGQDGSYLAELLLGKGYRVVGVSRRTSTANDGRILHLGDNPHFEVVRGDVTDPLCVYRSISRAGQAWLDDDDRDGPIEVYNLAAQSHVGDSFVEPHHTTQATYLGALNILEAIRSNGFFRDCVRFYQASSSEMFGAACSAHEAPELGDPPSYVGRRFDFAQMPNGTISRVAYDKFFQDEQTPMLPCSPYAIAKLAAHHLCRVYRESYGIHASSGILFNHECLSANTPLLVRRDGVIAVVTPDELVSVQKKGSNSQQFQPTNLEVWDGEQWTRVSCVTATKRRPKDESHEVVSIHTRAGIVEITNNHRMFRDDWTEVSARDVAEGDRMALAKSLPQAAGFTTIAQDMAEFLGLMVSEGYVNRYEARFSNRDDAMRQRVAELWSRLFLGTVKDGNGVSGFTGEPVPYVSLTGGGQHLYQWLRSILYHHSGEKRVPALVLNSDAVAQAAFLKGYYAGDGLKAGNGDGITTSSPVLALGLLWLYSVSGRNCSVYKEERGERSYWKLNLRAVGVGQKGQHLAKPPEVVRKKTPSNQPTDWVFDLETDTRRLMAGVGRVVVHNSERRGETFVTRKITKYIARWVYAKRHEEPIEPLKLGNLKACRDWGHAADYVRAMWLMLQQEKGDDYVVCTGETHTVEEFLLKAFAAAGLKAEKVEQLPVVIDPGLYRPCEVPYLRGDASKARNKLDWKPEIDFDQLVKRMVYADIGGMYGDALDRFAG